MGDNKWIWIVGAVVVLVLILFLRGGSSAQGVTATPLGPTTEQASEETARLSAASSAFAAYEQAGVASLQSNNAVVMNAQNIGGAETINAQNVGGQEAIASLAATTQQALASTEANTYTQLATIQANNNLALAKVKAKTSTNQSIIGLFGGAVSSIGSAVASVF